MTDHTTARFPTSIDLNHVDYALRHTTDKRAAYYLRYAATEYVETLCRYTDQRGPASQSRWLQHRTVRSAWSARDEKHYADMVTKWYRRAMSATA